MTLELEEVLLHSPNTAGVNQKPRSMKFVVVGDSGVGKTALCRRIEDDSFKSFYTQSIGVNFHTTTFQVGSESVIVQHLDIAGFERFSGMTQHYYRGAVGALVVFDLTSEKSLEATEVWKNDIDTKVCTSTQENIPCILVGTKYDLKDKQDICKTDEEFEKYVAEKGYIGIQKVSSLDNTDVKTAFIRLIKFVIENNIQPYDYPAPVDDDMPKRRCCC